MTQKEGRAKLKDLRPHGYYSDSLMLFQYFSANVDSVHNTMCYVRRCDCFAEPVLEKQGRELPHRYGTISRAYQVVVAKQFQLLMEYGFTQERQFWLQELLGPHLSSTGSFEAVYKALLVADGRQLLPPNPAFQLEYRNGRLAPEADAENIPVEPRWL